MSLLLAEAKDWMIMDEMTEMIKIAAQTISGGPGITRRLLEWAGVILIIEDILMTAALRNGVFLKLFSGRNWEMTEEVLEAMMIHVTSDETLQLVLDRLEDMEITGKILLAAARNERFGDQLVRLLSDRVNVLDIMNHLLVEAAGNNNFGLEIILLLQRRFSNINVTQEAVERAFR